MEIKQKILIGILIIIILSIILLILHKYELGSNIKEGLITTPNDLLSRMDRAPHVKLETQNMDKIRYVKLLGNNWIHLNSLLFFERDTRNLLEYGKDYTIKSARLFVYREGKGYRTVVLFNEYGHWGDKNFSILMNTDPNKRDTYWHSVSTNTNLFIEFTPPRHIGEIYVRNRMGSNNSGHGFRLTSWGIMSRLLDVNMDIVNENDESIIAPRKFSDAALYLNNFDVVYTIYNPQLDAARRAAASAAAAAQAASAAQAEADRLAKKAQDEKDAKARADAEEAARRAAEQARLAKEEAERKAREEAERRAAEEKRQAENAIKNVYSSCQSLKNTADYYKNISKNYYDTMQTAYYQILYLESQIDVFNGNSNTAKTDINLPISKYQPYIDKTNTNTSLTNIINHIISIITYLNIQNQETIKSTINIAKQNIDTNKMNDIINKANKELQCMTDVTDPTINFGGYLNFIASCNVVKRNYDEAVKIAPQWNDVLRQNDKYLVADSGLLTGRGIFNQNLGIINQIYGDVNGLKTAVDGKDLNGNNTNPANFKSKIADAWRIVAMNLKVALQNYDVSVDAYRIKNKTIQKAEIKEKETNFVHDTIEIININNDVSPYIADVMSSSAVAT